MTRTLIGLDYEGIPSLKITKGDLDPVTTPDSTPGAFLFNSKDTIQTRLGGIDITSDDASSGIYPVGANGSNFLRYRYNHDNKWLGYHYKREFFPDIDFQVPLTDFIVKNRSTGWYIQGKQDNYVYDANQNTDVAYVRLSFPGANFGEAGWRLNYTAPVTAYSGTSQTNPQLLHFMNVISNDGRVSFVPNVYTDVVVWNLPGDDTPLPVYTPQKGQESILIDRQGLRIAKPGFDVRTATQAQLAISSSLRATKIIAADDIEIPSGLSEYQLGIAVPANSVCDVQYYTGDTLVYPALPRVSAVGANWRLHTNKIEFQNTGAPCRARFIVVVNEKETPQTVGDNEVFRQFMSNGENVVQFLKPGAADPPSFSDIIIDSRWPSLRILKEGYFGVGEGPQITNVPINTEGYFPFIKMMVTTGSIGGYYSKGVRPATVGMSKLSGNNWFETGDTTYARVSTNNVAFHTFRGRVKYYYWNYNRNTGWRLDTIMPDPVDGIRYYIFGIPKKDTP
jgi:hypothetical protein